MTLFQNKYRIESSRLQTWNYGSNAPYFVTICTANREYYFGEIINDEMRLSQIGVAANDCWKAIPEHFPFVELGEYVVMPNHIHGIVIINKEYTQTATMVETQNLASLLQQSQTIETDHSPIETQDFASLPNGAQPNANKFGPQSQNLESIIRGFKIGVTKFAKSNNIHFNWQPRFHDHIIRDAGSFMRIQNYILTNPQNWRKDKFYKI